MSDIVSVMRFLFSLVAIVSMGASAMCQTPAAESVNTAAVARPDSEPPDRQFLYSQERFKGNMDKLAHTPRPIELIFDGDSITDGWQGKGREVWAQNFANRRAFDFGISGDRTQHVLWRLSKGQVDGLDPKLVLIMIGTNNIRSHSVEQIAEGVAAVVREYQKRCPNAVIVLQAIFPRGQAADAEFRAKVKEVNQRISVLGDGQKVIYLDFADKFLEPDGTLSAEVMPDFLHPSAKGYEIWAEAIRPIVDKYCPAP